MSVVPATLPATLTVTVTGVKTGVGAPSDTARATGSVPASPSPFWSQKTWEPTLTEPMLVLVVNVNVVLAPLAV